jgi:hypothetical protein
MDRSPALDVVSSLPCVVKDRFTGAYAPKGWSYYDTRRPWVFDIKKAKVYRNSAGAKNAMRGATGLNLVVLEFHTELARQSVSQDHSQ